MEKSIAQQINELPFDFLTKGRILELVAKAKSYSLNDTKKFDLKSAFMWNETAEGGDYWYEMELQLFKQNYYGNYYE